MLGPPEAEYKCVAKYQIIRKLIGVRIYKVVWGSHVVGGVLQYGYNFLNLQEKNNPGHNFLWVQYEKCAYFN